MHTPEHGLGRLAAPDERDRGFLLTKPREASGVEYRYWITRGDAYDQGSTPQCVSYAWQRFLTTNPVVNKPLPFTEFYDECQRRDEWPGEDYDGTSVRAGAKILKERGYCSGYSWAFDAETIIAHVLAVGPVVLGTLWTYEMFFPAPNGFIAPTGREVGGHAYVVIGASRTKQAVRIINSWGRDWGANGRAWLSFSDLDRLIRDRGEACTATEQRVV